MFVSLLPSTALGQQIIASVCFIAFVLACLAYRRLRNQNRRISTALNNMSQGLNMFDAQGRITLLNARYLEMYKLDPKVVKPGCTLKGLIEYRKETGLFSGDVDSYVQKILDAMAQPDVKEKMVSLGFESVASTPEEFAARIRDEIPKWGKVIRDAGIKTQ